MVDFKETGSCGSATNSSLDMPFGFTGQGSTMALLNKLQYLFVGVDGVVECGERPREPGYECLEHDSLPWRAFNGTPTS